MADHVLRIEFYDSPECPMVWDGQWTLYSFNRNSIHHADPEQFVREWADGEATPADIGLRRKLGVGLAFWLQYYEHGLGQYDLKGEGPQCRWDTAPLAGILVWENKPGDMGAKSYDERASDARAFLATYNNWMNGLVYGYSLETPTGEHVDSCWGFYEPDYLATAISSLKHGDRVKLKGTAAAAIDQSHLPAGVEVVEDFDDEVGH